MVLDSLEKLIEKYEKGETTLKEEQNLQQYFAQEQVAPEFEVYKPMFQYFSKEKQEQFTKGVPLKHKRTNQLYKWISVAAVAVLMVGIYVQNNKPITALNQLSEAEQLAFNQTVEGLKYLGINLNKSTKNLQALNLVSSNINKGSASISYINEFSKATNKILK